MDLGLKGKTIVVTGAGSGIGRATARMFLAEGAHVYGLDRQFTPDDADLSGVEIRTLSATDYPAMQKCLGEIHSARGGIDALVNNAGIQMNTLAPALKADQIDAVLEVNLRAVFEISRMYFALQKKQGGAIVNLSSVLGVIGAPLASIYSATKSAVLGMTRSLAMEWAKYNFRINAVCPGMIVTPMTRKIQENKAMFETNLRDIPLRRFGEPEEIARMILFLSSDAASYITGQGFIVDGGLTAR
jgi:3-oxoacyl-[acyl-carrier protein] reductase